MYQHQITPSVKFFTVSSNITSNACCTQSVYTLYTTPLYYLKKKKNAGHTLCTTSITHNIYVDSHIISNQNLTHATSYPIKFDSCTVGRTCVRVNITVSFFRERESSLGVVRTTPPQWTICFT